MNKTKFNLVAGLLILLGLGVIAGWIMQDRGMITLPGFERNHTAATPFQPSVDVMADIDAVLAKAREHDKLAIIIMGANWCEDSLAMVRHLDDPAMQGLIQDHYESLLVDVGYLEHGRDVINRFGMPVIYGTPTVLVVDPVSEQQINRAGMHIWRDAKKMSTEEVLAYFSDLAGNPPEPETSPLTPELAAILADIDAFEAGQAERVYAAFKVLGPMMAMAKEDRPATFMPYWKELRSLRYAITEDLKTLRMEARRRVAAGETDIQLKFPAYPLFTDRASQPPEGS